MHHVEACFSARFPGEGAGHEALGVQEFISKAVEQIQEARVLQGDRRPPLSVAHCPVEGKEFRVCIDILGLNRVASRQLFWLSCVSRCEGPPHSYVRMPFGLPSATVAFQHRMRGILEAREARHQAILAEMEMHLQEPPGPWSLPRFRAKAAHEEQLQLSARLLLPRHLFSNGVR